MRKQYLLALSSVFTAGVLTGCDNAIKPAQSFNLIDPASQSLTVDDNAVSCSQLADNTTIIGTDQVGSTTAPEPASGYRLGLRAKTSDKYMVIANTPLAVKAGCQILKAGGSAVDAAIAVQAVLGLVEPQSSTIAGSAFLLYFDAQTKKVTAYDGRETAPAAANEYYLVRQNLNDPDSAAPVPNARRSGRSIGVPGVMRMLDMAHQEHGKLKWNQLFGSAVKMADEGFSVPYRLAAAIDSNAAALALDANAVATYFHPDGSAYQTGEIMTNKAYARSLERIASEGAKAMYSGPMAQAIVAKAQQSVGDDSAKTPITPSLMTLQDLVNYKVKKREVICFDYRSAYHVCTMPPPSSGGIAIAQTLGILENFDMKQYAPTDPNNEGGIPTAMAVHLVSEAERLAYADRDKYVADPDFVPLPAQGVRSLLDNNYLKQRAQLINLNQSMGQAQAGEFNATAGIDKTLEHGTTQVTIVDTYGNVVSMTSTVESSMGSYHMVDGFLLSNQLTDFSAKPQDEAGNTVANRVQANKRPRSTMAPTIVFKGNTPNNFYMATGSPGGGSIIQYVVKTLLGVLDWQLDAQQATSLVNFGATNSPVTNVDHSNSALDLSELVKALEAKGHKINSSAQSSGVATILQIAPNNQEAKYQGGVDPRREGIVLGDGAL